MVFFHLGLLRFKGSDRQVEIRRWATIPHPIALRLCDDIDFLYKLVLSCHAEGMKQIFAILLGIQFIHITSFACEGSAEKLLQVSAGKKLDLIVCGIKSNQDINVLEVTSLKDGVSTSLFMSDDAFKTYRVTEKKESIHISEARNTTGEFYPFIENKVFCKKGNCKVVDYKCLWKKSDLDKLKESELNQLLKDDACEKLATQVDQIFITALNGNKAAIDFFSKGNVGCNAEKSEAFMTYQEDIKRLKKIKCL